jgi:hypothetical protein
MCEYPKIINQTKRKARKPHKCCECWTTIEKGEVYQCIEGLWDDFHTYRMCLDCDELWNSAQSRLSYYYDDGIEFGRLFEHVLDTENLPDVEKAVDILKKRNKVRPWMLELIEILKDNERKAKEKSETGETRGNHLQCRQGG